MREVFMTMNNIIKSKFSIVAAAFMLAILAVMVIPASTNACYDSGCYNPRPMPQPPVRPVPLPFSQPDIIQQPVYIQQPVVQPVYIQQPVYVPQPVVQPVYIQQPVIQPVYYSPLTVSCRANNVGTNSNYNNYNNNYNNNYSYNNNGYNNNSVTWTAYASGGNGNYSYSWSGSDGLYGSGQTVYFNYTYNGTKTAYVTVYSNGQSITQACTSYVQGTQYVAPIVYQNTYPVNYVVQNNNLDIGCYVDPTNAKVNQPVTWSAEVTGGMAPYNYSWSGSDDLSGSQSSVTKFYNTSGSKSAIVTVTSADGKTGTRACSNSLAIGNASSNFASRSSQPNVTQAPIVKPVAQNVNQTAAAMFSLSNIPWGWVAILVILVLFVTVTYLLFNRQKI